VVRGSSPSSSPGTSATSASTGSVTGGPESGRGRGARRLPRGDRAGAGRPQAHRVPVGLRQGGSLPGVHVRGPGQITVIVFTRRRRKVSTNRSTISPRTSRSWSSRCSTRTTGKSRPTSRCSCPTTRHRSSSTACSTDPISRPSEPAPSRCSQRAGAPKKPRWMMWASVSSTASSSRIRRRDASA
jgi:hypothetical protein